jgi:hypothetical protein
MNLTPQEVKRMEYLLGKSRLNHLTKKEEYVLRELIAKESPSAKDNSLDELIRLGLILVGLYLLSKALSEK